MDLRIFTRYIELNSKAEQHIDKKFIRLDRHLQGSIDAKLELPRTSVRSEADKIVAQMTMSIAGNTLRGQETGPNLFSAINAATEAMDRQIRKYKTCLQVPEKRVGQDSRTGRLASRFVRGRHRLPIWAGGQVQAISYETYDY